MRKYITLLFFMVFISTVSAQNDSIVIAYPQDFPPYVYSDADGEPVGILVDIWNRYAEATGRTIEHRIPHATGLEDMIASSRYDIVCGFVNRGSAPDALIGRLPLTYDYHVFSDSSFSAPTDASELRLFQAGFVENSVSEDILVRRYPNLYFTSFNSYEALHQGLVEGNISLAVAESNVFLYYLSGLDRVSEYKISPEAVASFPVLYATSERNAMLFENLNIGMQEISRADVDRIVTSWAGSMIGHSVPWPVISFCFVLLIIIVVGMGIWLWNMQLTERIHNTTSDLVAKQGELLRSKKELESTKQYLSSILDTLGSSVVAIDSKGLVIRWNKSAYELFAEFGVEIKQGDSLSSLPLIMQQSDKFESSLINQEYLRIQISKTDRDAGTRYFSLFYFPFPSSSGAGGVLRIEETTDLVKKDLQLKHIQKLETIGSLAGGIAHDFNNALSGIIGTVSLLKERVKEDSEIDSEELQEDISILENSSARAQNMVRQLLAISRKQEINQQIVDLRKIVENVTAVAKNTVDKLVWFQVELPEYPAYAYVDSSQMEQVLLNLIINAAHSMTIMRGPGEAYGGKLGIHVSRVDADVIHAQGQDLSENSDYWEIMVKDEGVGIPKAKLSRIFDPFYSTKEKGEGIGLGLSMAASIVAQHNGHISVDSALGEGTAFCIYVPVKIGEDGDALEIEKGAPGSKGQFQTILLVDDEELILNIAKRILRKNNYRVVDAASGEEAITLFEHKVDEIDAVILDIMLPDKSGTELFQLFRRKRPNIPILFCSGQNPSAELENILRASNTEFIQKPFTLENLSERLNALINKK
ncbi:MAG: response regulator [Spirochaetia bacterium]